LESAVSGRDWFRKLAAAYDGPIPPSELAAARWGRGAWERLTRGADAALIEAALRDCVAAVARLRRSATAGGASAPALLRLAQAVAGYRRASVAMAPR
jgi:hypothetical protein